jgi:hypothetical protein
MPAAFLLDEATSPFTPQIRITVAAMSLAVWCASPTHAIDKSKWPRVAPVIFIHGVGSAPPTFGVKIDKENVPKEKPTWPTGDDSKTGGYYFYKPELDSLQNCHDNNDTRRKFDMLRNGWFMAGYGTNGQDTIQTSPLVEQKMYGCNSSSGFWYNYAYFQPNNTLTTAPTSPNYAMVYDFLQFKTSFGGRTTNAYMTYDFKGNVPMPMIPPQGDRNNGVEFFDAYWTFGWPDGNVPDKMRSLTGMMYGTALTGVNHKWVKAKWSRNFKRNSSYVAGQTTGFKSYDSTGWNALTFFASHLPAMDDLELLGGSAYAPGTQGYTNMSKGKTSDTYSAADGKRTITYKYDTYVRAGNWQNVLTVNYVIEDKGYTGEQFAEETQFGQIGQLYLFIKKVLDKYYRDSNGPNWYLGNGASDPDARIVLVGHSQGGVLSRAVTYPGFQSGSSLEDGYEPMYYPKSLTNATYLDWDNSTKSMSGCWFDPRRHISGIVSISGPHYGSPIGYAIDGVATLHKNLIDQKTQNRGLYYNIWNSNSLGLDGYTIATATTEVNKFVGDINPVNAVTAGSHEAFNEMVRSGLRSLHHYESYKTFDPFDVPLQTIEAGRDYWQTTSPTGSDGAPIAPPSSPCEPAKFPQAEPGSFEKANHYRLYWQSEYDNWVRSFRLDENNNGGVGSEKVHTVSASDDFTRYGKTLCEEQIGRYTRLTEVNNPNYPSGDTIYTDMNPFASGWASAPALAKGTATNSVAEVNFDSDIKALTNCLKHMVDPISTGGLMMTGLFTPPIANPFLWSTAYEVYDNGSNCMDNFKAATNQTTQGFFHQFLTNAAQGAAYNPASVYLHRLNQRGGSGGLAVERRPPPARPDNIPIPFISITNNLASTWSSSAAGGAEANGDLTVNTLSQDIGFAYPDLSKSGSIAKFAVTGATHTMAPTYRDEVFGPYLKQNTTTGPWVLDGARNIELHKEIRNDVARLIFGLAIGQSPVLPNQGAAAAKVSEIESAYTQKDAQGFTLQRNNRESVQGKFTRLKGLNPDEILEPVALPYSSDRTTFLIDRVIVIEAGQELYVPAGSNLRFTPSGTIIVKSGGRFTLGGVPTFAGVGQATYGIRLVSETMSKPDIRFRAGAKLKYPDPSAGLLKSAILLDVNGGVGLVLIAGAKFGSAVTIPSKHLYGRYDSRPYQERTASADRGLGEMIYYPGGTSAANSLLQD